MGVVERAKARLPTARSTYFSILLVPDINIRASRLEAKRANVEV